MNPQTLAARDGGLRPFDPAVSPTRLVLPLQHALFPTRQKHTAISGPSLPANAERCELLATTVPFWVLVCYSAGNEPIVQLLLLPRPGARQCDLFVLLGCLLLWQMIFGDSEAGKLSHCRGMPFGLSSDSGPDQ